MREIAVLSVASEIFPLIKTGGLADVVGALPAALTHEQVAVSTLLPGYPTVMAKLETAEPARDYANLFGGAARVLAGRAAKLDLFVVDAPHLYARPGNPYLDADGKDYADNAERFAALARVGADVAKDGLGPFQPAALHAHDWQAALAPAFLHYDGGRRPPTVVTIHNIAFQGHFYQSTLAALGLPDHAMSIDGVEYFGGIGFLKAGLQFADKITTVSPTYAEEILTPEFGMALDGLLRKRAKDVVGIVNGVDEAIWNPARDPAIPQPFNALRLDLRSRNKDALQRRLKIAESPEAPLFGVISRLTSQKGLDLVVDVVPFLVEQGAQLALLGSGDKSLEAAFTLAAAEHPARVGCQLGYDETLAHLIQAGSDFLLVPSRFEPCGLTQLCALRYGAPPIVSRVGGLADTVIDANAAALTAGVATGLQFSPPTAPALRHAVERALALYGNPRALRRTRLNGLRADVSWRSSAKQYADLYRSLLEDASP